MTSNFSCPQNVSNEETLVADIDIQIYNIMYDKIRHNFHINYYTVSDHETEKQVCQFRQFVIILTTEQNKK